MRLPRGYKVIDEQVYHADGRQTLISTIKISRWRAALMLLRVLRAPLAAASVPKLPLRFNGREPAHYIKEAYSLGDDLQGPGRFDLEDPVQRELRQIRDWITMAERDALESRRALRADFTRRHR